MSHLFNHFTSELTSSALMLRCADTDELSVSEWFIGLSETTRLVTEALLLVAYIPVTAAVRALRRHICSTHQSAIIISVLKILELLSPAGSLVRFDEPMHVFFYFSLFG